MRLTTSFAAASLALALLAGPAVAQAPAAGNAAAAPQLTESHKAIAREVATVAGIGRSFGGVVDQILDQVRQITVTRPEIKEDLEKIITEMRPELELQQQQIMNAAAQVFAENLTEAELKDIDAFFKTPSGKRYVETQPIIMDQFVAKFQEWSANLGQYVMVRIRAELGKRGHKF